jgi:hypothetical protein
MLSAIWAHAVLNIASPVLDQKSLKNISLKMSKFISLLGRQIKNLPGAPTYLRSVTNLQSGFPGTLSKYFLNNA